MTLRLDGLRCDCGALDLIAVAPGHEPERHPTVGLLERPVATRCWCAACWIATFADKEQSA